MNKKMPFLFKFMIGNLKLNNRSFRYNLNFIRIKLLFKNTKKELIIHIPRANLRQIYKK